MNATSPRQQAALLSLAVAIAAALVLYPLMDQYYLHIFEADAQSTVLFTLAFASGGAFSGQPIPYQYPPYFDAQYIIYAISVHATKALIAVGAIEPGFLPDDESLAVFAIRHTNLVAYSVATSLSFLLFHRLSGQRIVALLLASFLLLSPHMVGIDLLRVDHVVLAFFMSALLLTVVIAEPSRSEAGAIHPAYGAVMATLSLTKMTSAIYLSLPVLAYLKRWRDGKTVSTPVLLFLASFCLVALAIMVRFLPHEVRDPGFTVRIALSKLADLSQWAAVLPKTPRLFYNVDQFQSYGNVFLLCFAASLVLLVWRCATRRAGFEDYLMLGLLGALSIFGVISFKYERGLYVLVPLYLATMARATMYISEIAQQHGPAVNRAARFGVLLVLCGALAWPVMNYTAALHVARERDSALVQVRLEPARWIDAQLPKGSRITIPMHSGWANPPLSEDDYSIAFRFLEFPYLDKDKMGQFRPPGLSRALADTDAVVINSFHYDFYMRTFSSQGHADLRGQWERFFEDLRRHSEVRRFTSAVPSYGVEWVDVYLVRRSDSGELRIR